MTSLSAPLIAALVKNCPRNLAPLILRDANLEKKSTPLAAAAAAPRPQVGFPANLKYWTGIFPFIGRHFFDNSGGVWR